MKVYIQPTIDVITIDTSGIMNDWGSTYDNNSTTVPDNQEETDYGGGSDHFDASSYRSTLWK